MSLLDDLDDKPNVGTDGEASIAIQTSGPSIAAGEVKRRRGRPPGSKNKPKEDTLQSSMVNAIRGVFAIAALIAGFFGYEQTEELTDAEAIEGGRAFTPLAAKMPWLADFAIWIGAPVWLVITMRKKLRRKEVNANPSVNGSGAHRSEPAIEPESAEPVSIDSRQALGKV